MLGHDGKREAGQKMGDHVLGKLDANWQQAIQRGSLEDHDFLEFLQRRSHAAAPRQGYSLACHARLLGRQQGPPEALPATVLRGPVMELLPFKRPSESNNETNRQGGQNSFRQLTGPAFLTNRQQATFVGGTEPSPEIVVD